MNANTLVMEDEEARQNRKWAVWLGRIISALPIIALAASAAMKLTHNPNIVGMLTQHLGFGESALTPIGLLELVSVVLYAIPATSVLGAVALSAYLGGAVASHVRIADPFIAPVVLGLLVWVGLFLRDRRLRALLPFRSV